MKTSGFFSYSIFKVLNLLLLTLLSLGGLKAQHYWVGGSGNWSDFANHWATSSGGSTFHGSPPSAGDDVIFDSNSFTQSGQVVTIDLSEAECNSMNWSGVTNNPGLVGGGISNTLNIYGSLTLSPDANYDFGAVEFESDNPGNTVTSNGSSMGPTCVVRFIGAGSWDLQDKLTAYQIQFYEGTFNSNNNAMEADLIRTTGSASKELNMGSSIITTGQWRTTGSNNTLNMGSSHIITNSFYGDESGSGPYIFNHVELPEGGVIWNDATINILTLGNGGEVNNTVKIESGSTLSLGELIINSTRESVLEFTSLTPGSEATLNKTSGSVNVSYLFLQDIHATGGADFTATESLDNGNNNGWTISPITPLDYYWVGDGGDWSDYENHWTTSSGGTTFHTGIPTRFDRVYFDANSFTMDAQTVVVDAPSYCASIDFTGATNTPRFYGAYQDDFTVYGPVIFIDEMTGSLYGFKLDGDLSGNPLHFGSIQAQNFSIFGSGEWTLMDDIRVGNFNLRDEAIFHSNDNNIEVLFTFGIYGSNNTLNLGSSEIVVRDFRAPTGGFTFDPGTSNFIVNRDFRGEGHSYYKITMEETSTLFGNNTIEILEILPATDASFESGTLQTLNQSLILNGTPDGPISLGSTTAGNQASLSLASGTVDGTFLILQDIIATGGATFNALESIDNGNNAGWNITEIVPLDFYWVGGTGNWSDHENHWATTSGGSEFRYRVPGALDNVYFDANSFDGEGQVVTIDTDEVNFHDMDWTGATGSPVLSGNGKSMNIFGSLMLIPEMDIDVKDYYFLSASSETITTGNGSKPGGSSYFYFDGAGEWTLQDSLYVRELWLSRGGLNTADHPVHVDFRWYFEGESGKVLEAGSSEIFARSMQWSGSVGDSLTLNASDSHISFSSSFSPASIKNNSVYNFGDLSVVKNRFSDAASVFGSYVVDTFTIEAGKLFGMHSGVVITMNQMIAKGTAGEPISIYCVQEGNTATFSQSGGTINAEFLELKDNRATGGAEFIASSSVDLGNVSGWTFTKQAQTITFDPIPDKKVDDEPFSVSASASSGLQVTFSILSGPASVDGSTITLSGQAGTVTVQARQSGDIEYFAAPAVSQTFEVSKLEQSIDFPVIPDKYTSDEPFTVSASASSGLEVTFSVLSGPASIEGNVITLTGNEGTVEVEASQEGNQTYESVTVVNSFEVTSDPATSVEGYSSETRINLWPNPVRDRLFIDIEGEELKDPRISIIDIAGQVVRVETDLTQTQSGYFLDVSLLPEGIYFLKVDSGLIKKFVINGR